MAARRTKATPSDGTSTTDGTEGKGRGLSIEVICLGKVVPVDVSGDAFVVDGIAFDSLSKAVDHIKSTR